MPLKMILKFCEAVQSKTGFSLLSVGGNGILLTMLSLVIKSSIQIVLQLFSSVEWDWNTICDRGCCFFIFPHYLALFLKARGHPWLVFHNSALHNSRGAEICHKKSSLCSHLSWQQTENMIDLCCFVFQLSMEGPFLDDIEIGQCAPAFSVGTAHGRACGLQRLEGLKSIESFYVLQDAWKGSFEDPKQISLPRLWVIL